MYWVQQDSLYQNKKYRPVIKNRNIASIANSPAKQNAKVNFVKDNNDLDFSMLDL